MDGGVLAAGPGPATGSGHNSDSPQGGRAGAGGGRKRRGHGRRRVKGEKTGCEGDQPRGLRPGHRRPRRDREAAFRIGCQAGGAPGAEPGQGAARA